MPHAVRPRDAHPRHAPECAGSGDCRCCHPLLPPAAPAAASVALRGEPAGGAAQVPMAGRPLLRPPAGGAAALAGETGTHPHASQPTAARPPRPFLPTPPPPLFLAPPAARHGASAIRATSKPRRAWERRRNARARRARAGGGAPSGPGARSAGAREVSWETGWSEGRRAPGPSTRRRPCPARLPPPRPPHPPPSSRARAPSGL